MTTLNTHIHHDHDAGLGATADLINTLELVETDEERLPTSDAAVEFLARHDLGHEADLRRQVARDGDAWLERVHATRAAIRELWDANVQGRAPDSASLAVLNELLDRSPRVELRRTLAGVEVCLLYTSPSPRD